MMNTQKVFSDYGTIEVNGETLRWRYSHRVHIVIHEKTETFACPDLGLENRMCLYDLKTKCRQKFRAAAVAEARREYVARIDAEEKRKILADVKPVSPLSEDLVR